MTEEKKYLGSDGLIALVEGIKEGYAPLEHEHEDVNTSITNIVDGTTKVGQAINADNATTADFATKATQDGDGKVISSTYETKSDASDKLNEAKTYTDQLGAGFAQVLIGAWGEDYDAETATVPTVREIANDEATKALESAKEYTDTSVGELSDGFSTVILQMYGSDVTDDGAPTIRQIAYDEANTALEEAKDYADDIVSTKADISHNHNDIYYTESEIDTKLSGKANSTHNHSISNVTNLQSTLDGKVPTSRTINGKPLTDNIALTAADVDAAPEIHVHDDTYYTESEIDEMLENKADVNHNHNSVYDVKGAAATVQENLDAVSGNLSGHVGNTGIHVTNDNKTQWNSAFSHAGSDHAPIDAEKNIIVGIQKNGTDLTVGANRKINIIVPTTAADIGAAASGHNHDSKYDAKGSADDAFENAKTYTDEQIANLLDNDTAAVDSIMELADAMKDNADAIDALNGIASGKANAEHTHAIADVNGLQTALDGKAASSHGTHVSYSTTVPVMDGTASVGTATTVARSDHKHPTDTSRAAQTDLEALSDVVDGKSDSGHTHTVAHTPAGSITDTSVTPEGTVSSTFTGTAVSHNHTFTGTEAKHSHAFNGTQTTISTDFTPAGSVSSSFKGTAVTSGAPGSTTPTTTVASSGHTHKYTPSGIVSKPTFTGSAVTSGAPSGTTPTTTVYSITDVGTLPSLTASVTNRCLSFTFGAGTLPTKGNGVSVATGGHTHSVTAAGTVSQPTFAGTEGTTTSISGTTSVASSGHTHSVTAAGTVTSTFTGTEDTISVSYTPAGTVGETYVTPAGTIESKSLTPAGTVESTFTGTAAKHKHTFTGTAATLTTGADN